MSCKIMLPFVIFTSFLALTQALGSCPDVSSVSTFDSTKLVGEWRNQARTFEACSNHHRCLTYRITSPLGGTHSDIRVESQGALSLLGGQKRGEGYVTYQGSGEDLHLLMKLGSCGERAYHVIYWDPSETSMVLYACSNAVFNKSHAMVLSSPLATHEAIENAEHVLRDLGYSKLFLYRRKDEGCRDD